MSIQEIIVAALAVIIVLALIARIIRNDRIFRRFTRTLPVAQEVPPGAARVLMTESQRAAITWIIEKHSLFTMQPAGAERTWVVVVRADGVSDR